MNAPIAPTAAALPSAGGAPSVATLGTAPDPLAELRGLHLPGPVGLWPPALGWWILLALIAGGAIATVAAVRRRQRSLGRDALRELDGLARRYPGAVELHGLATALSELLRRVALVRFGRRVASLHGDAWQAFLCEHAPHRRRAPRRFPGDAGRVLALAPYVPPSYLTSASLSAPASTDRSALDRERLLGAARTWIRWNT